LDSVRRGKGRRQDLQMRVCQKQAWAVRKVGK
jgi:hypothetical protein